MSSRPRATSPPQLQLAAIQRAQRIQRSFVDLESQSVHQAGKRLLERHLQLLFPSTRLVHLVAECPGYRVHCPTYQWSGNRVLPDTRPAERTTATRRDLSRCLAK